jgi:hypothetical protein
MMSLTREEIERIRQVNEMKRIAANSSKYKPVYYPGANLVLLQKFGSDWIMKFETGPWFDDIFDEGHIQ